MAEEDLLFGKNRHLFGGIEPSNMKVFKIVSNVDNTLTIQVKLPDDTVIDGQTLCTVDGAMIRSKKGGYPVDEFDGDKVIDFKRGVTDQFIETSATGETYYAAFPYSTQGVYNRNPSNRTKYDPAVSYYVFGYDLDTTNSDPSARVTYPSDVVNSSFTPAYMDYENDIFNYGSWPSAPGEMFMPKPCMLNPDGTVEAYLDPNDYTKTVDGETSNYKDYGVDEDTSSKAMMEWPKIYTHREVVNGIYKFRCSGEKVGEDWECWCNYDVNNNEIDHFYTSITSQELTRGQSASTYLSSAKAIGDDWTTEVISDHLLIQDLLVMMAKTTDCQTAYGNGYSCGGSSYITNHSFATTKGLFWGSNVNRYASGVTYNTDCPVKVFGMANWWGNGARKIAGFINDNGTLKIKITRGTKDGSTATDYNVTGDGYLEIGSFKVGNGYITKCTTTDFGRIPSAVSGSSTTYECDWVSNSYTVVGYAEIGDTCTTYTQDETAYATENAKIGPFYLTFAREQDYNSNSIGACLACKPRKK